VKFSKEMYEESQKVTYKWYMKLFLYGLIIPNILCHKEHVVVDTFFDRKEMYWRRKIVLHFHYCDGKGYVTQKSFIHTII
jgi:hypothetical protein